SAAFTSEAVTPSTRLREDGRNWAWLINDGSARNGVFLRNFLSQPARSASNEGEPHQGSYSLEWPSGYGAELGIPFSVAEPERRTRGGSRARCRAISTPPARNICATSTRPSASARPPIRVALAGQRARSPRRRCATPSATQASSPPTST